MKCSSIKEGNYKSADKLLIEFKDGSTKEFLLLPTITIKEVITDRLSNRLSDFSFTPTGLMQRKMTAQILLIWVDKINELINKGASDLHP